MITNAANGETLPFQQPRVSITICSIAGWPRIQRAVSLAEIAAARVIGEIIIMDRSGRPTPPAGALAPTTSSHRRPGRSVLARAPIIAATEDPCLVDEDGPSGCSPHS